MNKYILPVLFCSSLITLVGLSKIIDNTPVEFDQQEIIKSKVELPLSIEPVSNNQVIIKYSDNKGKPLFYSSYDAQKKKTIKIQYAIAYPPDYNSSTYNKPIVVLGHDGYDKAQKPNWDKEMKGPLNYLVKNLYRLATPIAQAGSIVIIPAYRGENQSQGTIDVAGGDVMDTIAAIRFVKSQLPKNKDYSVNLVGTSRGALTSVMTASVFPVNKVVIGYGVMDLPSWIKNEADCGTSKDCVTKRDAVYKKYKSYDQVLDAEAIKVAKANNKGKLPAFTRVGINIEHYANPKTTFYIGQGLNDKHVKPYNSFKMRIALMRLSLTNALDVYYGTHSTPKDGTHGIYTRVTQNYISDQQKRGATIDELKSKFITEATTVTEPTVLVESPLTDLSNSLGSQTLSKIEK